MAHAAGVQLDGFCPGSGNGFGVHIGINVRFHHTDAQLIFQRGNGAAQGGGFAAARGAHQIQQKDLFLFQALPQLGGLFIIGSKNALFYFQNFHVVHGGAPYMCLSQDTLVNSLTSGWRKRNVKRRFWYSRQIGQKEAGRMTERRHTACRER